LAFAGQVPEALELIELALTSPGISPELRALSSIYRARFLLFEGKALGASRHLKEVAPLLRRDPVYGSWGLALLAEAEALLGHSGAAADARNDYLSQRRSDNLSLFVDEQRALAWVPAQGGRLTQAIAELWAAADTALERGQRTFELIILNDLLRLGEVDAAARARDVSELVEGPLGEAVGLHVESVVSRRGMDLEMAASSFSHMSFSLVASELWAAASGEYQREGLQARSTKAARRAYEAAGQCEGARITPTVSAHQVEPLSRRQHEIALLAAQGASNAEIAQELSLSVRTVESHLYAAFAKLGLTSRAELSSALASGLD
jgi:DNA-binding CsgD family transcriptional regulator